MKEKILWRAKKPNNKYFLDPLKKFLIKKNKNVIISYNKITKG